MAGPRKKTGATRDAFEDTYPRVRPPEREEPAQWSLVRHHLEQALHGCKSEDKTTPIRDDVEYNLRKALDYLLPKPAQ